MGMPILGGSSMPQDIFPFFGKQVDCGKAIIRFAALPLQGKNLELRISIGVINDIKGR